MVARACGRGFSPYSDQKAVREREREVSGREQEIPFIGRPPVTYFL
jgi:hypothetical protein